MPSTLDAFCILCPAMRNYMRCMAQVTQLPLGAFMHSLAVKGLTKSGEALQCNDQFAENETADIGKSQRLWIEGNARINKVSAMQAGLAKTIEKVPISRHCEWPETDIHIAEIACCIDYVDSWSSKQVHWLSKSHSTDRVWTIMDMNTRRNWTLELL